MTARFARVAGGLLTGTLERKQANPETSPDFDLHKVVNDEEGPAADLGGFRGKVGEH